MQVFNISKRSELDNTLHNIELGLQMLENEIDIHNSILQRLILSKEYQFVKNTVKLSRPDDYLYLDSLKNFYNGLCAPLKLHQDSFIMFKNNEIVLSKTRIYDNGRNSYGAIWRFEDYSYQEIKDKFLSKKYYGEFLKSYNFHDLVLGKNFDLVYVNTISSDFDNNPNVVFFSIYDSTKIVELCGLSKIAQVGMISIKNINDEELFHINNYGDFNAVPDITCVSKNSKLKVSVAIPKSYYSAKINSMRNIIVFYILISILIGFIFSTMFAYKQGRPIERIIGYLSMISGKKYNFDNEYHYIETAIKELNDQNTQNNEMLLDKLFVKLILTGLNPKEVELFFKIEGEVLFPYRLVLLKNNSCNNDVWSKALLKELSKKDIDTYRCVVINKSDIVLFITEDCMDFDVFRSIILQLNKEKNWDIRGVIGNLLNELRDATESYKNLKKAIQYLEYGKLMIIENINVEIASNNKMLTSISNNRKLYELIRSGNEFEAKRLVYEQWYILSEKPGMADEIERLFYMQTGVLLQLSMDLDCTVDLPEFDGDADVVKIAFSITECIERICKHVNENRKKEDKRTIQILDYINEHAYDASFYMPELVEKFSMSDRKITQLIKNMTGETFSNYVSQLRIKKAEELIKNTDLPISEVAVRSGYDSSNSLYKAFKKVYGVSPSAYRESRH